jgi:hypothetical protein
VQLSQLEKEKQKRQRHKEAHDRRVAQELLERDFRKYTRLNGKSGNHRISHEDLVAIQQIEIDRGNYNVGADYIRPAPPRETRNKRSPAKNAKPKSARPPPTQRNVSKDFRPKKAHPLDPTIGRPIPSVAQYPDSDGIESVESFGEFHSPKESFPVRRIQSLDSILDTDSVCADGHGMNIRVQPGVYQKTPPVLVAERDYHRHKQNKRDVRREHRTREELHRQEMMRRGAPPNRRPANGKSPQKARPKTTTTNNNNRDVHHMLYGPSQRARQQRKKKSSDCSVM